MINLVDILIVLTSVSLITFIKLLDKNPQPILGCYQRNNGFYWVKVAFMYLILSIKKLMKTSNDKLVELHKQLLATDKAIDTVYMNGADMQGNHLVVGSSRRGNMVDDRFLILKINDMLLQSPKLSQTYNQYYAEGIKISPVEVTKKWRLSYEGEMTSNKSNICHVKIDGVWSSNLPSFKFDTDMDPLCTAKSVAFEKWNVNYFHLLNMAHQTHYEQYGTFKVSVTIDNKEYKLELDTICDHRFGMEREWCQLHRCVLHYFTSTNGDHFLVGKICSNVTFSRLTVGYIYSAVKNRIYPLEECDMELYQHGELGKPPQDYAFSFKAGGNKYTVEVKFIDSPIFYIHEYWKSKFYENLCKFKVNGIEAWGAAKWQYRNLEGKETTLPQK